ncbi:MAG: hypothetical protein KBD04_05380 [Proteobacteria bacterium]|nr:hypothetical protein [Pseudomonadota bacterium]
MKLKYLLSAAAIAFTFSDSLEAVTNLERTEIRRLSVHDARDKAIEHLAASKQHGADLAVRTTERDNALADLLIRTNERDAALLNALPVGAQNTDLTALLASIGNPDCTPYIQFKANQLKASVAAMFNALENGAGGDFMERNPVGVGHAPAGATGGLALNDPANRELAEVLASFDALVDSLDFAEINAIATAGAGPVPAVDARAQNIVESLAVTKASVGTALEDAIAPWIDTFGADADWAFVIPKAGNLAAAQLAVGQKADGTQILAGTTVGHLRAAIIELIRQ